MTREQSDGPTAEAVVGQLEETFGDLSGKAPEGLWRSPGRVNLIGEHTDYNDGLALPFAIERATFVAARRHSGRTVHLWSTNREGDARADLGEWSRWDPVEFESWARYPLGVIWAMLQRGAEIPGLDMVVASTLPLGGGLSSSAALTVSVGVALDDIAGAGFGSKEIALICQQAETSFAGVPCGLLDQTAVLEAKAGYGVLIDFSSMATELVPIDTGPLVVINTRVERTNASGAYADRRAACAEAAKKLGLPTLRQADLARVETELEGDLRKRARHVVTENARVKQTALRLGGHGPIGDLLVASHISLREDFEVSCPELDLAVGTALDNGADGARLTGAGLGGCAIALGASAADLTGPLEKAFAARGFKRPEIYEVAPADGAGRWA